MEFTGSYVVNTVNFLSGNTLAMGSTSLVLGVISVVGLISFLHVVRDILRRDDMSREKKAGWVIAILVIPYIPLLLYYLKEYFDWI